MIRRAEHDRIDIFVLQQLSVVDVSLNFYAGFFTLGGTLRQDFGVHIAERNEPRAGQLVDVIAHVAGALRVDTDDGDTDVTRRATGCGRDLAVEPGGTGDERGAAANKGRFKEVFAGPSFHGDVWLKRKKNRGCGDWDSGRRRTKTQTVAIHRAPSRPIFNPDSD